MTECLRVVIMPYFLTELDSSVNPTDNHTLSCAKIIRSVFLISWGSNVIKILNREANNGEFYLLTNDRLSTIVLMKAIYFRHENFTPPFLRFGSCNPVLGLTDSAW